MEHHVLEDIAGMCSKLNVFFETNIDSSIKAIAFMCHRNIIEKLLCATNVSVYLRSIFNNHDWEQLLKIFNNNHLVFLAKRPIIAFYEKKVFSMLAFITHFIQWQMDMYTCKCTFTFCLSVINNFECSFTNFYIRFKIIKTAWSSQPSKSFMQISLLFQLHLTRCILLHSSLLAVSTPTGSQHILLSSAPAPLVANTG
ncbi:hypothetical protein EGR_10049 [Echinococcus granulosus]|uniref:Uncharacterized protein n=1 Tax=Echinococcus granulosus TaxID=6210 RepID=W6U9C2_ECHGR|nr:hypothetical protein EGR_10049 [Echinococcus granulosus]EUB55082.1 hypothetical protein EGR_10049 [Echinococcus granulosus]